MNEEGKGRENERMRRVEGRVCRGRPKPVPAKSVTETTMMSGMLAKGTHDRALVIAFLLVLVLLSSPHTLRLPHTTSLGESQTRWEGECVGIA